MNELRRHLDGRGRQGLRGYAAACRGAKRIGSVLARAPRASHGVGANQRMAAQPARRFHHGRPFSLASSSVRHTYSVASRM